MKNSCTVFFLFLFSFVSLKAQESAGTTSATSTQSKYFTHYVGEIFGGGIIFSLWKDEKGVEHGLIASLDDVSKGMVWNTYEKIAGATSLDDGATNTKLIVEALDNCTICAAGMCAQYKAGGFTDWYLPASWELFELSKKVHVINAILSTDDSEETQPLTFDYYWSSTEGSTGSAWRQNFADSNQKFYYHKYSRSRLRAVRRF